jgi:hypothetical protein
MVQRRLPGRPVSDLWPVLSPAGRERAVEEAGRGAAANHQVPAGGFYRRHDDGTWDFPDARAIGRAARRDREGETPLLLQAGFSQNDVQTLLEMLNDPDESTRPASILCCATATSGRPTCLRATTEPCAA